MGRRPFHPASPSPAFISGPHGCLRTSGHGVPYTSSKMEKYMLALKKAAPPLSPQEIAASVQYDQRHAELEAKVRDLRDMRQALRDQQLEAIADTRRPDRERIIRATGQSIDVLSAEMGPVRAELA